MAFPYRLKVLDGRHRQPPHAPRGHVVQSLRVLRAQFQNLSPALDRRHPIGQQRRHLLRTGKTKETSKREPKMGWGGGMEWGWRGGGGGLNKTRASSYGDVRDAYHDIHERQRKGSTAARSLVYMSG